MDVGIWCMNILLCIFVLRDHMRSVILCFLSLRQDLSLKMASIQAAQQASNPPVSTSYSSWIVGKGAAMMQHVQGRAQLFMWVNSCSYFTCAANATSPAPTFCFSGGQIHHHFLCSNPFLHCSSGLKQQVTEIP